MTDAPARPYRVHRPGSDLPFDDDQLLARVRFVPAAAAAAPPRADTVQVALPRLSGEAEECWISPTPVHRGRLDGLDYAENGEVLFGHLWMPEPELQRLGLARAVFQAYGRIEHLLQSQGYPHWLRMWNYLAEITGGEGDEERYRQFSLGRHRALALKPGFENHLPAATAIGTADGGLVIYFLGGRIAGRQVENPRQVSAFAYPRQYGPRSPSFSRATLVPWADGAELLVSGTASVVGHETRHADDPAAQMRETFANLDSLLVEAGRLLQAPPERLHAETLRLYLRHPDDVATIPALCRERYPDATLTVLHGEVCRRDLQLEIEGSFRVRP